MVVVVVVVVVAASCGSRRCACVEVRCSAALRDILHVVLITGNHLNAGGHAADAVAFTLRSLLKLHDIRQPASTSTTSSSRPRISLVHYVAEVQRSDSTFTIMINVIDIR